LSAPSVLGVSSTHQYYLTVQDEKILPPYLFEMQGENRWVAASKLTEICVDHYISTFPFAE